ncbi:MAG: glycine C-acetyltransferase [Patescibacteria group bacterium]|jgi:glycine C-acetyltransferase
MYSSELLNLITQEVSLLKANGKYKFEAPLESAQSSKVKVAGKEVLMFASNNYLGLANHPEIITAAKKSLDQYGYGLASVRFIAGTTKLHLELEKKCSEFLGTEDTILFGSCFAANEAFFTALIQQTEGQTKKSVIYSDELNHASIIDGLKLVKKDLVVKRIYAHNDSSALEQMLKEDENENYFLKIIASDGVFSMEGELAKLPELVRIATDHRALLFVDDSHGVGVCGAHGQGSPEELNVSGQIDVLSGTFGKALGGAAGGYLSGKKELIEFMRQKARPYIFSNSLPPMIVASTMAALDLLHQHPELIEQSKENTAYFRQEIKARGFKIIEGDHPIVPIMIGEAALTQKMAKELLARGLYLFGLWFPVVPEGQARLRAQISAAHTRADLNQALDILTVVGKELGVIK